MEPKDEQLVTCLSSIVVSLKDAASLFQAVDEIRKVPHGKQAQ